MKMLNTTFLTILFYCITLSILANKSYLPMETKMIFYLGSTFLIIFTIVLLLITNDLIIEVKRKQHGFT
jgi:hypothetical protein